MQIQCNSLALRKYSVAIIAAQKYVYFTEIIRTFENVREKNDTKRNFVTKWKQIKEINFS